MLRIILEQGVWAIFSFFRGSALPDVSKVWNFPAAHYWAFDLWHDALCLLILLLVSCHSFQRRLEHVGTMVHVMRWKPSIYVVVILVQWYMICSIHIIYIYHIYLYMYILLLYIYIYNMYLYTLQNIYRRPRWKSFLVSQAGPRTARASWRVLEGHRQRRPRRPGVASSSRKRRPRALGGERHGGNVGETQ